MSRISIEEMIQVLDMEVIYEGKSLSIDIETSDINRPGLQFAGFLTILLLRGYRLLER